MKNASSIPRGQASRFVSNRRPKPRSRAPKCMPKAGLVRSPVAEWLEAISIVPANAPSSNEDSAATRHSTLVGRTAPPSFGARIIGFDCPWNHTQLLGSTTSPLRPLCPSAAIDHATQGSHSLSPFLEMSL
ncbi:hypothetical protein LZ31DRAFT_238795 [Colletotrichum somersetense]|nr:hypothetical protein LZ31DRAFT_238795 [Colletotrichum somersetense]